MAALHQFPTTEELEQLKQADFIQEINEAAKGNLAEFERLINDRAKIEIKRGSLPLAFQLLMLVEERRK